MTDINTTPTTESRVVILAVTGAPDLSLGHSNRAIVPDLLEITYHWEAPKARLLGFYTPGYAKVKVGGCYRLKSGDIGEGRASREFWSRTEARPGWLSEIVAAHQPPGWAEDTYTVHRTNGPCYVSEQPPALAAVPATEDGAPC